MFQQRSWLLSREGHEQRIADFLASVINDDECWKCVHMHVFFFFFFFFKTQMCIAFLKKVKVHHKDCQ